MPLPLIANATSDCLFNWAERAYTDFFKPAPAAAAGVLAPYYYRYYSGTGNYVGVSSADNHVYVYGPISGNQILDVGRFRDFQALAGCPG